MVPYSPSIWYHIPNQNGTIFYRNMVPYSFTTSPLLKIKASKTRFQNNLFHLQKGPSSFFGEKGVRSEEEGERCKERGERSEEKVGMMRGGGWLRPHAPQAGLVLHAAHPAGCALGTHGMPMANESVYDWR